MTLRYGHLAPEHLRNAIARLDPALPIASLDGAEIDALHEVSQKSLS
jgi:hypothetical protein